MVRHVYPLGSIPAEKSHDRHEARGQGDEEGHKLDDEWNLHIILCFYSCMRVWLSGSEPRANAEKGLGEAASSNPEPVSFNWVINPDTHSPYPMCKIAEIQKMPRLWCCIRRCVISFDYFTSLCTERLQSGEKGI